MTAPLYRYPFNSAPDIFLSGRFCIDVFIMDSCNGPPFCWNPTLARRSPSKCDCSSITFECDGCKEDTETNPCNTADPCAIDWVKSWPCCRPNVGEYEPNCKCPTVRCFTVSTGGPGDRISIVNSRIADDYVFVATQNPFVIYNPNVLVQSVHATFATIEAAGNYLWLNSIGSYVSYQARSGLKSLRSLSYSGYFPIDRVRDSNVPVSARNVGNFFVYTVIDNSFERQNIFIAMCSIIASNSLLSLLNVSSLSSFGQAIPLL